VVADALLIKDDFGVRGVHNAVSTDLIMPHITNRELCTTVGLHLSLLMIFVDHFRVMQMQITDIISY